MDYQAELNKKILERKELIQENIKNNALCLCNDGSFKLKVDAINEEIGQLKDKLLRQICG